MKHEPIAGRAITRTIKYIVCITLAILSVIPFWIMIMNATRGTYEIQQSAISLLPSTFLKSISRCLRVKPLIHWWAL